jgi:hypothetical protein
MDITMRKSERTDTNRTTQKTTQKAKYWKTRTKLITSLFWSPMKTINFFGRVWLTHMQYVRRYQLWFALSFNQHISPSYLVVRYLLSFIDTAIVLSIFMLTSIFGILCSLFFKWSESSLSFIIWVSHTRPKKLMVFMGDQNKEVINLLKLNIEWCFKECNIKVTEFNIVSIRKI